MSNSDHDPGYLCYAWGESDFPIFRFVKTPKEVGQFFCDEWFGQQPEAMVEENREQYDHAMERVRSDRLDPDGWDGTDEISFEFEIGGISVKRCHQSKPTEAAAMAATVPDIVFTDEMDCTHHWSHAAATEFMRKFFNEWPGGMSEVESALRTAKQAPVAGQPAEPSPASIVPELVEEMAVASDPIAKLNHALVEVHGAIAVVYVDFGTKWFTITSIGTDHEDIPNVGLEVSETAPDVEVSLPGRKGWRIVSASASKYSLTVVLKAPGAAPKGDSNG